jgi:hypothetical protein
MNRSSVTWYGTIVVVAMAILTVALVAVSVAEQKSSNTSDKYVLKDEPKEAADVIATREKVKDKEDIVVVGRIGGRPNPWVKGAAAFSIVDTSLKACNEIPGDKCKTPWDYCCEANLPKATLLVTIVDETTGQTVKQDARELLKAHELQTVVVQGKARRDKAGNVSIAASKVYIRPDKEAVK